ncbi:hypothetical protein ACPUVO_16240 [Pseudocolwellia sp. HL-MZ19]|uniref:hypothetical protein n=1 Tax=Pseudocolwellia sp. HL-MZ19 TaxID=3400846 RepID=UPI003CF9EC3F
MSNQSKNDDIDIYIDTIHNQSPLTIGDFGGDAVSNFNWIAAIDSWDYSDPTPLSEMVSNHIIPKELRPIISKIISGERKQNKIGGNKLKLPAKSRLVIASLILELRHVAESGLNGNLIPNYNEVAEIQCVEVIDVIKKYRKYLQEYDQDIMEITGLSKKSVQNLLDDLKRKLKNYPDI